MSLIFIELSLNFKEDGGMYLWIKSGLGPKYGFLGAWFYWACNFFYYPGILTFLAIAISYILGNHALASNPHFIACTVIIGFWIAVLMNMFGLQYVAKLASFCGGLNLAMILFIIVCGAIFHYYHYSAATTFSWQTFWPHQGIVSNLSNLAILMFALTGLELIPTLAGSVRNPQRTLPVGLFICTILLIVLYMTGTVMTQFIMPADKLTGATGLFDVFATISQTLHIVLLVKLLISAIVIVDICALILWLIAPTIMFFECVEGDILPEWLRRLNHNHIPMNSLLLQGALITILILLTTYLPGVNDMYMVLILMASVVYFLPCVLLCISYFNMRRKNTLAKTIFGFKTAIVLSILSLLSLVFGIVITFVPESGLHTTQAIVVYEAELIGGPILFILAGYWIYRHKSRQQAADSLLPEVNFE